MKTIKDILTSYESEPSAQCWETLSHNLDAAMPQGQAPSSQSAPHTSAGTGSAHTLWTAGSKIAAAVLGTAVVATTTVLIVTHRPKQDTCPPSNTTPIPAQTDSVQAETHDTTLTITHSLFIHTSTTPAVETPAPKTESETTTISSTSPITPAAPSFHLNLSNNVVAARKPGDITPSASTTATPISTTQTHHRPDVTTTTDQEDPALQNLPDDIIDRTPPVKIEIPNVFTPNGDGYNDYFTIKGIENCNKRQLVIRNKSGNIVYRSNFYENNWAGDDCPDGPYRYQFIFNNGNVDQSLTGNVYIVRTR